MSGPAGQHVIELGSGASPLIALACLRRCRSYTGTDGSKRALALLADNLSANSRSAACARSLLVILACCGPMPMC